MNKRTFIPKMEGLAKNGGTFIGIRSIQHSEFYMRFGVWMRSSGYFIHRKIIQQFQFQIIAFTKSLNIWTIKTGRFLQFDIVFQDWRIRNRLPAQSCSNFKNGDCQVSLTWREVKSTIYMYICMYICMFVYNETAVLQWTLKFQRR